MSTTYKGLSDNIANNLPGTVAISSSTDTNPISVFTTTAHGLSNGDYVDIQGHHTNYTANGVHKITVTGAFAFTIPVAGAGAGAGGNTGTVQPLPFGPAGTIPSDGDDEDAASVNVSLQRLSDQTAYLGLSTGQFKLAQRTTAWFSDLTGTSWAHSTASLTAGTPAQWLCDGAAWFVPLGPSLATPASAGTGVVLAVPGVSPGDLVACTLQATVGTTAGFPIRLALYGAFAAPGVVPSWPSDYAHMVGSSLVCGDSADDRFTPVSLSGFAIPATRSTFYCQAIIYPLQNGAQTLSMGGDAIWTIDVLRPTGVQQ